MLAVVFSALKNGSPNLNQSAGGEIGAGSAFGNAARLIFPVVGQTKFSCEFGFDEILHPTLRFDVQNHHDERRIGAGVFVGLALRRDGRGFFK